MKSIIRIEHVSGNGLWRAKDSCGRCVSDEFTFIDELRCKHYDFPTPFEDTNIDTSITFYNIKSDEFCAFKSVEQIQQWIEKEWFIEIIKHDFKILLIDVSECIELKHQIIYKKEHVLQVKNISNLFL